MINNVKIMVVEQDSALNNLIVDILEFSVNRGVVSFNDGFDAFNYVERAGDVDMIICSYDAPGMSGIEMLSAVKKKWPDIICIMIADPPYDHEPQMKTTLDAYLSKYFDPKDVFDIVQRFVVDG